MQWSTFFKIWPGPACRQPAGSSHPGGRGQRWWQTLDGSDWLSSFDPCDHAAAGRCWRSPPIGSHWKAQAPEGGKESFCSELFWDISKRNLKRTTSELKHASLWCNKWLTLWANCWAKTSLPTLYVCVRPVSASLTITLRDRPANTCKNTLVFMI